MADYRFSDLERKYERFGMPKVTILVNQKDFARNKDEFIISEVDVELTSGMEASMAVFRIYNIMDKETGKIRYEEVKNYILLGSSVSVSMGYQEEQEILFLGFIASVTYAYEEAEIPYIEVTSLDVKGVMMSTSYCKQLKAASYAEAVREVFSRSAYDRLKSSGAITQMDIANTPDKDEPIEMVCESDYEFVVKAAKKFNYEFYTDRGIIRFREAKSNKKELICLSMKEGLLSFSMEHDLTGMTAGVEVRAMDSGKGEVISAVKKYTGNLSDGSKGKGIIAKSEKVYIDPTVRSVEMAEKRTRYLMDKMSYGLGTFRGVCIGMPELVPGRFVNISGLGTPVDNKYYVTQVHHSFEGDRGYRTSFTGRAASV